MMIALCGCFILRISEILFFGGYMGLQSYSEVLSYLNKKGRQKHLLLGNGFSVAYDPKIFSYNALHNFIQNSKDDLLIKLFSSIKTKNFELIMRQLSTFIELLENFEPSSKLINVFEEASHKLKIGLIDAIKNLHPDHVFKVEEEKSKKCAKFLSEYLDGQGSIFSTNYDVLLYWTLLRNEIKNHRDGFGRDVVDLGDPQSGIDPTFSDLYWGRNSKNQNVFYLHGALALFDSGAEIVKEEYRDGKFIVENIRERIDREEYPVFVTAGDGNDKLDHIMHNKYLANCYEKLTSIEGSLITFGFSFGQFDDHIIQAINRAAKFGAKSASALRSIYIGVYTEADEEWINSIEHKFSCKVKMFDAKTVPVW